MYNVLTDVTIRVIEAIIKSKQRFQYQYETLLPSIQADVLVLNEVSPRYLHGLLQSRWLRQGGYYISTVEYQSENVIISTVPFLDVLIHQGPRNAVVGLFCADDGSSSSLVTAKTRAPNRCFAVIGAHLSAYEKNPASRVRQIQQYLAWIRSCGDRNVWFRGAIDGDNLVVMGDMNFHFPFEDKVGVHTKWVWVWVWVWVWMSLLLTLFPHFFFLLCVSVHP